MTNNIKYVKTLTVSDLFDNDNKCNYIIPIYQRNYAWGDNEISSLLQDIKMLVKKIKNKIKNIILEA